MLHVLLKYLPVALFAMLVSCGEYDAVDCETYDYSTCIGIEPDSFDMEILFTQINDSEQIPFILYKGEWDMWSNQPPVYLIDTAISAVYYIRLPFGENYTVKAEYKRNNKKVFAIDGALLSKTEEHVCDSVCWSIDGKSLDARLKNFE